MSGISFGWAILPALWFRSGGFRLSPESVTAHTLNRCALLLKVNLCMKNSYNKPKYLIYADF